MINFWGIQRSFLIIRGMSSGWKYNFSGRRGAVNGQQLVMDAVRAEHPCEPSPAPSLWHSGSAGEWWAAAKSGSSGAQHVDVTLHTLPRLQEVIREITWLTPSHLWWYLSLTASTGNSRKFQFLLRQCAVCVSPVQGLRGEEDSPAHALADPCTWFVYGELRVEIKMQIRSALST